MQRVVQPKTKRGKRFLENRESKLIENDKTTLFIRGINANNTVLQAMKNFAALKKPRAVFMNRKEDIKPFENIVPLESLLKQKDTSLFGFGSHNKKRTNNLVLGRAFDCHVLDMFEFGIEDFRPLQDFKTEKVAASCKPMLLFTEGFDETSDMKRLKNFFIDFFRGPTVDFVNVRGLEHLIAFCIVSGKILLRSYRVQKRKTEDGSAFELEEIGPHMNLVLRRTHIASDDYLKKSCKKPLQLKPKKKQNITRDVFGSTKGRIHMKRQDYKELAISRMKGLRKQKSVKKAPKAPQAKKMKTGD